MEFNQTLYILIGQSLFFVVVLALCLKLAADKHRLHLKKIVEQVNKTAVNQDQEGDKKQNSQQIRELLMKKIQQLQTKNAALEKIEVQHTQLKAKYESLRLSLLKKPGESNDLKPSETKQQTFERKAKSLSEATGSTNRASHELKNLNKKNSDQRGTIEVLRAQIKKYEIESNLNQIQNEKKDAALVTLDSLEQALIESQSTSDKLETNLESLRRELDKSQKEVDRLEKLKMQSDSDSIRDRKSGEKKSYTLISKDNHGDIFDDEKDPFEVEAIQNYHILKSEVQRLRSSTSEQRKMIFTLEGELVSLRKELELGGLSQEDQEDKEVQLAKLEKLLAETEGCVGMLEEEISYLQERIETMSSSSEEKVDEEEEHKNIDDLGEELELVRGELKRINQNLDAETKIRDQLANTIWTVSKTDLDSKIHVVVTQVLEALEDFGEQAYVKVVAKQGEVEVANTDKVNGALKMGLAGVLKQSVDSMNTVYELIDNNEGLLIAHKLIGAYIKIGKHDKQKIEQLRSQIEYLLVVADSMILAIDKSRSLKYQKQSIQRLVQKVKQNLSTRAVQSKYKTTEAKRTINDFLAELQTSLQTMNLTENQSKFFDVMIDEVRERMQVVFETDVAVDTAFAEFIEKLDRNGGKNTGQAK